MKRRTFLVLSLITFCTKLFANSKNDREKLNIIKTVMEHMFPSTSKYNGAGEFKAFRFLMFVTRHPTFDKRDFEFLLEGAGELKFKYKDFLSFSKKEKEKALREFESTQFGQNWLSFVLYYCFEAMLGDPVYHGNKDKKGWENINHTTPVPTASKPFGELL